MSLVLVLLVSGCSSLTLPPLNEALKPSDDRKTPLHKHIALKPGVVRSDNLTLVLTFSGGGTRAAAFSYGVLKELESMKRSFHAVSSQYMNMQGTMLDEVDLISSVSGGSFTAAYYGLYGKRIFSEFEQVFLKRPVQSSLLKYLLLSPSNWVRLIPSLYERSDLAADYYEKTIFGKKRYKDMLDSGPRIVINATDIASGKGFSFTKKNFKKLCSDIGDYPVGRAVVASSAVPVVFSPIVLKNYADRCPVKLPRDNSYKQYLHLVDGGVVDNLGIRSLLNLVNENGNDFWRLMKTNKMRDTHKVIIIVVNASDSIPPVIGKTRIAPATSATLGAVTTIQSRRYNQETLNLLKSRFPIWKSQVKKGRCAETRIPNCGNIDFQMTELNFNQLPADLSRELSLLETSLELPPADVDLLIEAGRMLLRQSPVFQQLLSSM